MLTVLRVTAVRPSPCCSSASSSARTSNTFHLGSFSAGASPAPASFFAFCSRHTALSPHTH